MSAKAMEQPKTIKAMAIGGIATEPWFGFKGSGHPGMAPAGVLENSSAKQAPDNAMFLDWGYSSLAIFCRDLSLNTA
jgi:hypothetical protein